ncbi:hypothetical protein FB45DRAFT_1040960 [Roridomyces roridus]|uniref:Uncharacterized protein n=1 Tax=Roridomyces roridus TaxID=1738132 RepID=A0AAD7B0J6_9AGAR|nr:hypothetical protein FB45DRAFT_1040960 [Roridomyces roridus]
MESTPSAPQQTTPATPVPDTTPVVAIQPNIPIQPVVPVQVVMPPRRPSLKEMLAADALIRPTKTSSQSPALASDVEMEPAPALEETTALVVDAASNVEMQHSLDELPPPNPDVEMQCAPSLEDLAPAAANVDIHGAPALEDLRPPIPTSNLNLLPSSMSPLLTPLSSIHRPTLPTRMLIIKITGEDLGRSFDFLLRAWGSLETGVRGDEGGGYLSLPSGGRPTEVAQWIGGGRKNNRTITDLARFKSSGGRGGMWLAALYWWGCAEKEAGGLSKEWEKAVDDAEMAFYGLRAAAQGSA